MKGLLNNEILTNVIDDLPIGIGIFQVVNPEDLKSVRYIFMNKIVLHEMRKVKEEVFGKYIIEVAPEAYEHENGLAVIKTYRDVSVHGESVNLGMVEYSNHEVAGTYECSVHHIRDNYIYVMLRNVTELEQSRKELAEINKNLENIVDQRTAALEQSREELAEININLESRVKERTAELEIKNKELEQFAYISSHDLQEPLRTISNYIQIIREDYENDLDEDVINYLETISKSTDRMRTLIFALLDFSKIGRNSALKEVDTNQVLADVLEDLYQLIHQKKAKVLVDHLPIMHAFETELRQIFQNLITNAIKFQKEDQAAEVKIHCEVSENQYQFSVADNGIGIASKDRTRIFQIFQRLHSEKVYQGSGIGLAHCKKIVEMHKGNIWVDSEAGQGSVFHFTISKQLIE
ncbi:ATP-binding protein [Fulvivirga maritima]|uniref:sensor histidine kinase n=1 Tax=Fulvivirga maritima TaxID=2904247 RepID=UPI001F1CF960|nr:ATP-binding protein [Fulvivirga maritima]UII25800.1 ATP-binding protein [Fulvivirga maritima]